VTIELSCPSCGSNRIAFVHAVSDNCAVTCENCHGAVGTYGELKQLVAQQLSGGD
jgi:predicted nucleic acid-binding Zn ribbon protein